MSGTHLFISDLHLGHNKIIQYEEHFRPFKTIEDHDKEIIARWNSKVKDCDTVWILGDMVINKKNLDKFHEMKGRKLLIMGNHDNFNQTVFDEKLLNIVDRTFGCVEKRFQENITVMTHIPVIREQVQYRFHFNLHGHLHSKYVTRNDSDHLPDLRYVNLSAEHWNLTPVSMKELDTELRIRREMMEGDDYYSYKIAEKGSKH